MTPALAVAHECADRPNLPCPACLAAEQRPFFGARKPVSKKEPLMNLSFSLAPALHDHITQTAQECGINVSEFCRQALTSFLEEIGAPE